MTKFHIWQFQGLLIFFFTVTLVNQLHSQCNPPDQIPTSFCQDAPLVCLLNACYETLMIPNDGPNGWCFGNNTIENPQFFQFIPTDNNVEIHIHVDGCVSQNYSLQAGIIDDCPWTPGDVLACNGGTSAGGTIILYAAGLQEGEIYWLMLDGSSGSQCSYTITYINNIYSPEFEEELTGGAAIPYDVCLGADELVLEVYPPIALAHGYYWLLEWSNDTIISTEASTTVAVPANIAPGIYEICVSAFSGCDNSEQEICFEVNVHETLNGERDPVILCPEEFPISWGPLSINGAGEYERLFSAGGCDFDSVWIVESYPVPEFVIIDTVYCLPEGEFSFYYENEPYDQSGTYELFYSKADVNGCDSIAELDLVMLGIDADASFTCENGAFVLTASVEELVPFNADLVFQWFRPGENVPTGVGNPFVTQLQGCYDLIINVGAQEGSCDFFIKTICIDMALPQAAISFDSSICVNDITTINFTGTASTDAELIWDFNSPSSITGSGQGPYNVTWNNPGQKIVQLTVIEPGCDTAFASFNISVDVMVSPIINCTSTLNSILFDWNDVPAASGYLVSLNGSPATPVTGSDTLLTMLTQGSSVELVLTTVSSGPCPDVMDTVVCTAQNCPAPVIELSGEDSVCLNTPALIDLEALVNSNPGTGTWNGTGVIDFIEGIFDPKLAGSGQHQLTYTVIDNGCSFTELFTISVFDSIRADFILDPIICISDFASVAYSGNATVDAVFNFDFGAADVETGSGSGPYQLSWNSPGQKTIALNVEENGCTSEVVTQSINVVAELAAPVVPCVPNTNSVIFSWTLDPAATDSIINVLSGHTGILSGSTYTFDNLVPGDIVSVEIISQSTGPCPERRDTFECEARLCPPVELSIDPVNDICLYPNTNNINLNVSITNGNGSGQWMGSGVIDTVNGIFNPNLSGTGAHLITYHYVDDGCDFLENITINVYDVPIAIISNTNPVITCTSGAVFLDGSSSIGTSLTYQWTTPDGSIANGANNSVAEVVKPGQYQLLVLNDSGCKDSVSINVTQDENIPIADAGPDKTITCDSTQFLLGGISTTGVNVIYIWSTPDGNIVGPLSTINVIADQKGDYQIIVRDTITGCQSQDNVMIHIDTAVADITLTPGDTINCDKVMSPVTSALTEPAADYLFSWSTTDGMIEGAPDNQDITVSQGGTYVLTIINIRNGCEATAAVFVAESDDVIDNVIVQQKNVTCYGDADGSLSILQVEGGVPDYTFSWSVNPVADSTIADLTPGVYTLKVTDANGCSHSQEFIISQPDLMTLDLGNDRIVNEGDSVKVNLITNLSLTAVGSITWAPYNGMSCDGCTVFEFIAMSGATIFATITDTSGCFAFDSMQLTVLVPRLIYIPNIFSPNGDGINDYFTISGRHNLINISSFRIFDRWGTLLFENSDMTPGIPQLGWDGKFKNDPMPPGVYVFTATLEYNDLTETVSGSFTLVR